MSKPPVSRESGLRGSELPSGKLQYSEACLMRARSLWEAGGAAGILDFERSYSG